jgi:hypothetical protein
VVRGRADACQPGAELGVARQLVLGQPRVAEDHAEQVVEVVGDAAGQAPQALQPLALADAVLQLAALGFAAAGLGHIARRADDAKLAGHVGRPGLASHLQLTLPTVPGAQRDLAHALADRLGRLDGSGQVAARALGQEVEPAASFQGLGLRTGDAPEGAGAPLEGELQVAVQAEREAEVRRQLRDRPVALLAAPEGCVGFAELGSAQRNAALQVVPGAQQGAPGRLRGRV